MLIWKETTQQAHVESVRILEVTIDPKRKDLFEATSKLVRHWKSWSQNILAVMELKSRAFLCWQKRHGAFHGSYKAHSL